MGIRPNPKVPPIATLRGVAPTTTQTDIYVRPDGSDSNSGLSPSQPKRTLQAAIDLIPALYGADVVLHVGGTPAQPWDIDNIVWPKARATNNTARLWVVGDGADGGVTDPFEEVATGTISSVVTANFEFDVGVAPGDDTWADSCILFTSGAAAGMYRSIDYNEGTVVRIATIAGAAAGDTFRILRPAVRFQYTKDNIFIPGPPDALNYLNVNSFNAWVNIGFEYVGAGTRGTVDMDGAQHLLGVYINRGMFIRPTGQMLGGGTDVGAAQDIDYSVIGPLAPVALGFNGWGLQQTLGDPDVFDDGGLFLAYQGVFTGVSVVTRVSMGSFAYMFVLGGRSRHVNLSGSSEFRMGTTNQYFARGTHSTASVIATTQATLNGFNGFRVDNTGAGSCIRAEFGCRMRLDSGSNDSGNSAAAYGIDVQSGANVLIEGLPQYTGALADTRVESTTHANAFYSGPGIGEVDTVTGSRLARVSV